MSVERPPLTVSTPSTPAEALPRLPALKVDGRIERLRERLTDEGVDAATFRNAANVRWLTGFTGSNGTVVVSAAGQAAWLLTDARYTDQAPAQLADSGAAESVEVVVARDSVAAAANRLGSVDRLGLEDSVAWAEQIRWSAAAAGEIVPLSETVETLRSTKDDAELARICAAATIADSALTEVEPMLRPGVTEAEIQRCLDDAMRSLGASGPAYATIVASGPNSALPHAEATDRRMQDGDLLIIDVGALLDGYRSDMTRTFVIGQASEQAEKMLDVVTRSHAAGVEAVRPGTLARDVDAACRAVIADADMGEAFIHGTGHGVGLDIHELPRINSRSDAVLEAGHVLTVEPGVYFPGVGGVRIEDLLVVTEAGCSQLTRFPKHRS